jgi:bifunctional ADP-heptose synthase (sugar kinase/adenylyltransferase)
VNVEMLRQLHDERPSFEQWKQRMVSDFVDEVMADVDYVVLFDEESVLPLVEQVRPDVLVKGGDYSRDGVVGHEFVDSYGGEVRLAPKAQGFSTTELIDRIAQNHDRPHTGGAEGDDRAP